MLLYVLFVILLLPATILTLGGAFTYAKIYGPLSGYFIAHLVCFISATLGAMCAFVIGRFILRDCISKYIISKVRILRALDNGLRDNGFKIVCLMRMSPLVPYNIFNYGMSVTAVKM